MFRQTVNLVSLQDCFGANLGKVTEPAEVTEKSGKLPNRTVLSPALGRGSFAFITHRHCRASTG